MNAATRMNARTLAHAGLDRVGAEVGTDAALLDDFERRRQGARAQQDRSSFASCTVKLPRMMPLPPRIGSSMRAR